MWKFVRDAVVRLCKANSSSNEINHVHEFQLVYVCKGFFWSFFLGDFYCNDYNVYEYCSFNNNIYNIIFSSVIISILYITCTIIAYKIVDGLKRCIF